MDVRDGFSETVGNTPLIRLRKLSEQTGCEILGKAEFLNPGGSTKDRMALAMLRAAFDSGELKPGGIVIGEDLSEFFGPTLLRFQLFTEIMLEGTQTGPPAFLDLSGEARLVTTYVYTPVPEPGTGMMLTVGIGMMAMRRKRAG